MAYFSPILAAQLTGLTMAAVSFALPERLSDHTLPPSLFAELDPSTPKPSLSVTASPNGDGWRLDLEAENWAFSELCGRTKSPMAKGHAHIYLGETKIGTATLPVFYIDDLPTGPQQITVTLRAADHRVLVHDGQVISAHVTLNHPAG